MRKPVITFSDLGPLEQTVLESLWRSGESSVLDVTQLLDRPLAYTTVMTTLDRLYKKGVLDRRQVDRAFHYRARFTREEMQRRYASAFVDGFLGREPDLLFSCLVDAVGSYDAALLDDLEKQIRKKRQQIERRKK